MATEHRAQVEELMADYRRSRERLASAQQELAAITETARSAEGTVRLAVGPHGVLRELAITEEAYRRHSPAELSRIILGLATDAAKRAASRAGEALAPALPAGVDPRALLDGRADLEPPDGPGPPETATGGSGGRGPEEQQPEEEPFEEGGWLQDGKWKRGPS